MRPMPCSRTSGSSSNSTAGSFTPIGRRSRATAIATSTGWSPVIGQFGSLGSGSSTDPRARPTACGSCCDAAGRLSGRLLRTNAPAPRRFRTVLKLAVQLEIHPLVEETEEALDAADLGEWLFVVPDEVLGAVDRVVAGCPLVRAAGHGVAGLELGDHVLAGDVP